MSSGGPAFERRSVPGGGRFRAAVASGRRSLPGGGRSRAVWRHDDDGRPVLPRRRCVEVEI